jgi:hypothetical protein
MKLTFVAAFGAAVALAAAAPAHSQGKNPAGVDPTHYQCYQVTPSKSMPAVKVDLKDQFGGASVQVGKPIFLCAPVTKNGEPPKDADTHFVCYQDTGLKAPNRRVQVTNQLDDQVMTVTAPSFLCVPTVKKLL